VEDVMGNADPKLGAMNGDEGGEGNYDASRRYREGLEKSVEEGRAGELAEQAKHALEGEEGDELRRAEEEAKRGKTQEKQ
jgi:hypothetical protein